MMSNSETPAATTADATRAPGARRRFTIEFDTHGQCHIVDLSGQIKSALADCSPEGPGVVHLFVVGSTAALSTTEYEPGLVNHDLRRTFQSLVPDDASYEHEATWNDDNGHSHVRATLIGPSLTIPYDEAGNLLTGTWQQVVVIDFDTRPRRRTVIGTLL